MIKNINNNKVLVISHIADIDGAGSIILANKYYDKKIDFILCEVVDLIELFKEDFSNYDIVYVCDLSICMDAIKSLENNPNLVSKLKHFDHHSSMLEVCVPEYANYQIMLNGRKTCGTELFYNYLLTLDESNKVDNNFYKILVDGIRENDTWDFVSGSPLGQQLASIHAIIGAIPFIEMINSLDDSREFELPKMYIDLVDADHKKMKTYIENANNNLYIADYNDKKIGIVFAEQYRSTLGNDICEMHPEIEFILIINFCRMSCSLRSVKNDINLGKICLDFHHDGGGHKKAAGFAIDGESMPKLKKYIDGYINNIK